VIKVVGSVRKSDTADVRVTTSTWKGRAVVDIRVWYLPDGSGEFVASRKGLTIDAGKVRELIGILERLS
jgi:hypothetical protein